MKRGAAAPPALAAVRAIATFDRRQPPPSVNQQAAMIAEIAATSRRPEPGAGDDATLLRLVGEPLALLAFLHRKRPEAGERPDSAGLSVNVRCAIASIFMKPTTQPHAFSKTGSTAPHAMSMRAMAARVNEMDGMGSPKPGLDDAASPFEPTVEDIARALDGSAAWPDWRNMRATSRPAAGAISVCLPLMLLVPVMIVIAIGFILWLR